MGRTLRALLSGLYALVRGKSRVATALDPVIYRYTHMFQTGAGSKTMLNVVCQRLIHTVNFKRWYMPTRVYRTYKVQVVTIHGDTVNDWPTAHYPELSPWFMEDTNFPFFLAINAYIDGIIEGLKESPAPSGIQRGG